MISSERVKAILQDKLEATQVAVQDDSWQHAGHQPNNPAYLTVVVESAHFSGKGLLAQHRMVYDALREEMAEQIHALRIKTQVPPSVT